MKRKLFLFLCALLTSVGMWAQWTDVTSTYITNANLKDVAAESSVNPDYWPVYTMGRTGNTQHPNNWYLHTNGTTNHNGGGEFFECWAANQGVKRWTLFQDVTLPAGTYQLTGQYSTNESRGIIKTVVITPHHTYFSPGITSSNWGSWGSETAEFTIYEETKVRIGMISNNFAQNHGFTLTTKGAKQLLADEIAAAPAGVSTTAAQAVYDDGGSDDAAYRSAAKTLHDAIVAYNIENALSESPVDMTDYITDPSFEGIANATAYTNLKHDLMDAWSAPSVNDGGARSLTGADYLITDNSEDGFYAVNLWNGSATTYYVKQTISGLPVGRYVLTATYASDANNTATLSMESAESTITATGKGTFVEGSVAYNHTVAGDVEIKLSSSKWFKADNFKLSYLGDPLKAVKAELAALKASIDSYLDDATYNNVVGTERTALIAAKSTTAAEETLEAYETAIASVQGAINNFTGAKTNYDLLATEITKATALGMDASSYAATSSSTAASALTSTQNLKVAEYAFVTTNYSYGVSLGEWTKVNAIDRTGQHWDNTSTSPYSEQNVGWDRNSWTCSYSQDINIPAGKYVFKVAGRKSSDNATLTLNVKNGDDVIGTVNDFPNGDTGLGINTSGATSFDPEDAAGFAFDGAGRGWEWRYVQFELDADATISISIEGEGTAMYQWLGFCNATVQTDDPATIALIAYNIALNAAITARDNQAYKYVGGTDRSNLVAAINADDDLDKTDVDAIEAATETLNTTRATFVGGVAQWNAYTIAKNTSYPDDQPYASEAKYAAIATAKSGAPNTAAEAETKTNDIISAYRKYIESNALAEGVAGAENKTSLISDPNFAGVTISEMTAGGWTFTQGGGTAQIMNSQSFTDGDGNHNYSYFDYANNDNNNQHITQTINNLPAGQYLLTVTARAQSNFNDYFFLKVTDGENNVSEKIPAIGNSGGTFDGGWNDVNLRFVHTTDGDITIEVYSDGGSGSGKRAGWWSATRFRLVRLSNTTVSVTLDATTGFSTFASPYPLDFTQDNLGGAKAYIATSVDGENITFEALDKAVPANTGVLFAGNTGQEVAIPVVESGSPVDGNIFEVNTNGIDVEEGYSYYGLMKGTKEFRPFDPTSVNIPSNKAYLKLSSVNPARLVISFDEEDPTAINAIEAAEEAEGLKDGKYLIDSKIVIVKNGVKYSANGQILK